MFIEMLVIFNSRNAITFSTLENYEYNDINTMLPFELYGCETRSLTLRGEHKLHVLENKALRKISELSTVK
jgi:hypothetical protein